jgi:hypothetical protein
MAVRHGLVQLATALAIIATVGWGAARRCCDRRRYLLEAARASLEEAGLHHAVE